MKYLADNLQDWADIVYKEIVSDKTEYFWPKSYKHKIFEQAYMKFVNRNLNYFNFPNMVITALFEKQEYHPGFQKTLEFCSFVRKSFNDDTSPFGRMCIWYIPPNCGLKPHVDNFQYHNQITRYIFIVSDHKEEEILIKVNAKRVNSNKGILFEFFPGVELHEFVNKSSIPFYFLGFDVWNKQKLLRYSKILDLDELVRDQDRINLYGGPGTKSKYMSNH